jgi:gluconokinase
MVDKIRLHAVGALPQSWVEAMGGGRQGSFDWRCCQFLQIDYAEFQAEVLKGLGDEELLNRAYAYGREPSDGEIEIWNAFMKKRGWRDNGTERLHERLAEIGLPPGTVETMFEFIDLDEGRLTL